MKETKNTPIFALIFRILGFVMGVATLAIQIVTNITVDDKFVVHHLWAFFTVQTNILATIMFFVLIIITLVNYTKNKKLEVTRISPVIHLGCSFYIAIAMVVYWLALAPGVGVGFEPLTILNNIFLHLFTPLFTILDCLFFMKHGELGKNDILKWLIYPVVYFVIITIFANITKVPYYEYCNDGVMVQLMYPYPFLDPQVMGKWGLVLTLIIILSLLTALGLLYISIDRKIRKRIDKKKVIEL